MCKNLVGIYQILCKKSGRIYVGSSKCVNSRWAGHKELLRAGKHHSRHLQRAWNKYGIENFVFSILRLFVVYDKTTLIRSEQFFIDKLDAYLKGFNTSKTAGRPYYDPALNRIAQKRVAYKHKQKADKQWADPEMRLKMIVGMGLAGVRRRGKSQKRSEISKKIWQDPTPKMANCIKNLEHTPEHVEKRLEGIRKLWADPIRRSALLEQRKKRRGLG